jgi:hypothetical protein
MGEDMLEEMKVKRGILPLRKMNSMDGKNGAERSRSGVEVVKGGKREMEKAL